MKKEKIIYIIETDNNKALDIVIEQQKESRKLTDYTINPYDLTLILTFESDDSYHEEKIDTLVEHNFYDVFVKWSDEDKERMYKRCVPFNYLIELQEKLFKQRIDYFKNRKKDKSYIEYIRVE